MAVRARDRKELKLEAIDLTTGWMEVSSKLPLTITVGTAGGQTSSYAINIENSCYLNFMYLEHIHNLYPSG